MEEINPVETTRAYAFEMWMKAPMPMVTFFKTLDVASCEDRQTGRSKIQYADVLVHRQGGKSD